MKKILFMTVVLSLLTVGLAFGQGGPSQPGCDNNGPHGKAGMGQQGDFGPGNCGPRGNHAFGPRGEGRMGAPGIRHLIRMADELELTDVQIDKLEKMAVEFKIERIDLEAQIEKEQVIMRSMMKDDNAREADILTEIDKVSMLEANMKKMHYKHFKSAQEVLTTEQITKMKELRKTRPGRDGNDPQDGRGMRQGRDNG